MSQRSIAFREALSEGAKRRDNLTEAVAHFAFLRRHGRGIMQSFDNKLDTEGCEP